LRAWTGWVITNAKLVLWLLALITLVTGYYAVSRFSMDNNTSKLIRQDTEWRAVHDEFITTFPQYDQNTTVVLTGSRPNALMTVTEALAREIANRDDVYRSVLAPGANQFAQDNALLFIDTDTLNDTISRLADAQPFLSAIAEHDSLRGVLELLIDALESEEELPTGIDQIANAFELALETTLADSGESISWRDELLQLDGEDTFYQIIFINGKQEFGKELPNGLIVGELESIIANFDHPLAADINIRVTGQVPLEHGEIVSAWQSVSLAGSVALVMLVAVLLWGVRSLRVIAATYLSMSCGLIWTAAWAMLAIGHYNTISVMFLVMFIGLGVDFAIHLCLKYQESLSTTDKHSALVDASEKLGTALVLCGITSGVGFLAFVPTEYIGLRELGIISAGGMVIAVVVSLTLIPAFFAVTAEPLAITDLPLADRLSAMVTDKAKTTSVITLLSVGIFALIASNASFDYSTLSLKDPASEAMTTLQELHDEDIVTDYVLNHVATDLEEAEAIKQKLNALKEVSEVITPADYLPNEQAEKLYLLEDGNFLLDSVFFAVPDKETLSDSELSLLLRRLLTQIDTELTGQSLDPELKTALVLLKETVNDLLQTDAQTRQGFSDLIVAPLKTEIAWLQKSLAAEHLDLDDLPHLLRSRLIAEDGRVIVSITPAEELVPVERLRRYTESVKSVAPAVTGRPVLDLGIGEIVVTAFFQALVIAIAAIFLILLMTLRSLIDTVLVFIPLGLTALVVLSFSVLTGMSLNMANVVVIPLIFGLGVDNGIHIVKRYHQVSDAQQLIYSSTPKAVFLSNLTSFSTFSALSFSSHQGIYSIGILLTIGLFTLMFLTLISLPALLTTFSRPRHQVETH